MRAPLFYAAIAFSVGILLQWAAPAGWVALGVGALAGLIALLLLRDRPQPASVGLLILVAMLGMFRARVDGMVPAGDIRRIAAAVARPVTIRGILVSDLEPGTGSSGAVFGWLEVRAIRSAQDRYPLPQGENRYLPAPAIPPQSGPGVPASGWKPLSGKIRVRFSTRAVGFGYGDELQLSGLLRAGRTRGSVPATPSEKSVPGTGSPFDEARWLWLQGAGAVLVVPGLEGMKRLAVGSGVGIAYRRAIARFRLRLEQLSRSLLSPVESAYLEALLLGNRRGIPREAWEAFKKTGTLHLLVVSGLHVGLVGFIGLTALALLRVPRSVRYFALAGILLAYCFLTGARIPTVRATLMGILLCLARWRGTEAPLLNWLGAAAFSMLLLHPRALADVSFQLSFAAVAGILILAPLMLKSVPRTGSPATSNDPGGASGAASLSRSHQPPATGKLGLQVFQIWLLRAFAVSLAAWLATAPLIAWHFQSVAFIAPFANLLVVPWACLMVGAGFLVCGVGAIHPGVALPFAASFGWMAHLLDRFVRAVAQLPGTSWAG